MRDLISDWQLKLVSGQGKKSGSIKLHGKTGVNMQRVTVWCTGLIIAFFLIGQALAHSEHGKARYVSNTGKDSGYCENALRPCKTISYAVQRANKGDKVLVAGGSYQVTSAEELFYLKSEIVPIFAGFNRFDHFQSQSPDLNQTFLLGVPAEMAPALREKGFKIINDGKSQQTSEALTQKMTAFYELDKSQADVACVNGSAGNFPCQNVDLVSHFPLSSFSSNPNSGNDIWGHVDLNTGKEYAIMGVQNGAAVIDLSNPESPVEVGTVSGSSATWRDIKVYQYFDETNRLWRAYAYVTVDGAQDGVTIIDLNNLPNSISLVERNNSVGNAHNVYISNVDHSLNIKLEDAEPLLQLVGASNFSGSFHSYALDNPTTIQVKSNQSSFNGYTHDGASVLINDSRMNSDCFNATQNCTVFVDFNEKEMVLWDITNPTDTRKLSEIGYNDVPLANQYIHSGWVTEDKRFILLHDEFDENRGGLNSTVRIFQIDNLRSPVKVGQWTGPTRAIDHNGFVRGNRYYMSNYERGMTILDITDPANPTEIGYFDTFPSSDNASFNGAWGVYPYLPSGLILASDINSGLYVLRDKTQSTTQGSLGFTAAQIEVDQGTDAVINVSRQNNNASSTSVSVKYEILSGSATKASDFTTTSGTLEWNGNESGNKSFNVTIASDPSGSEPSETFYIRLYDPTSGVSLSTTSYLTVKVNGVSNSGAVEFEETAINAAENSGTVTVNVNRVGGAEGAASVEYQLQNGTAMSGQDFETTSGTLNWQDGESTPKSFTVNIINDTDEESSESFTVSLSTVAGASLGAKSSLTVTIADDDSNTAPAVSTGEDFQANTGQTVQLTSTVTDAEGDALTYQWTQTSGTNVAISSADQAQASFVAPSAAATLEFMLTATDSKGAQSSDSVQVSVIAPPPPPTPPASSSGGGSFGGLTLIAVTMLLVRRKRLFAK
ncbi:choice-of-anchor B family protein [Aliikangiella coralliicola]|uniref:Choice-of-anchor B family protein n=1 Tax=Aliikangiella coralliicola TaxID=2592383 RepID=A0A545UK33_9GAMM|nr:choice-of-anchor B family protein [Aliikangiella coralliicola]TQV89827.1 choice-of-anchor B family protein [Aliikangiella coralliicola]